MYTRAPRLVELANRHPSVYDVHTHNATLVFGVAESQVSKDQRFLGKIVSHGSQRGMTGNKLSDKLLSDYDLLVPPDECQGMLNRFLDELWEIKDIFFPWVKQEIIMKGRLINSWGQVWNVKDETLDEDLYRRGYSFPMQSEAARMMFNWGLIPVHKYLTMNYSRLHSRINIPRHDALIMSVPFDHLYEVSIFTLANLERPREIMGNWLTVPCSIKVGLNDAYNEKKHEGIEFKSMPKRDEFMDRVKEVLKL
jgi:DNA polymerase I-like protein with 3'-5' exonuclease and polymerase domains